MRVLIDGLTEAAEWSDLSDSLLQVLKERGGVVVEVTVHHDQARVADASDQRLSDRFVGKPLARLVGESVADTLAAWVLSDAADHRRDLVVMLPGAANDLETVEQRTTHTRLSAIRDQVGGEGCLYLVLETFDLCSDARWEHDLPALRRNLDHARMRNLRLQVALDGVQEERRQAAAYAASVADLTHELRSALSGMTGLIGYMSGRPLREGDQEHIVLLKDTTDTMLSLLNGSLRKAQDLHAEAVSGLPEPMARETLTLASEAFSIKDLVDSVAGTWTAAAAQAGVTMRRAGDDLDDVIVRGDPLRLRQVLTNILANAVKFSEAGGSILLVVTRDSTGDGAGLYKFEVTDCGPGIEPAVKDRLFERGVRGASTSSGAGLGLNLSQELVVAMGGSIRADDAPGGGTRMIFDVPMIECSTARSESIVPLRAERTHGWQLWKR